MARILIADDHDRVRQMLRQTLELDDHDIVEASNGTHVLAMLDQHQIDIAVLDVIMPGLDGLSLCRQVRNTPGLDHIGIIIVSANARSEAALAAGADVFLHKPFLGRDLRSAVTRLNAAAHVAV